MTKSILVIEIGSQWLKFIVSKPSLKGHEITDLVLRPISSFSNEDLSKELLVLFKELKLKPQPLIVSFPRNLVTMRNLHLPSSDPKEIASMVELHMARQVPYPKEEITGGHQILGVDDEGYTEVILAIVHHEALRKIFNILDSANLSTEKIELSSQGIFSWFLVSQRLRMGVGDFFILLDIDSNFTDFSVVSKDNLLFTRSIPQGTEQINTEPIRVKFISELRQSLVTFQSEERGKIPSRLFISGSRRNFSGLDSLISQELKLPVEVIDPFKNIPLSAAISKKLETIPKDISINAVLGLALDTHRKKIEFSLPDIQIRKTLRERSKELLLLGSLLMYIFLMISGVYLARMYNRQAYLKFLSSQFQDVNKDLGQLDPMIKRTKVIKDRLDTQGSCLNYLYQIHRIIPSDITLKSFTFEAQDKVTLRGQALEMSGVFKFISTLEGSGYFKNIQTKYTTKKKIEDKDIAEFEIVCPIKIEKK